MTEEFESLKQALQSEPFVITAEIPPPVSAGPGELEAKIDLLKGSARYKYNRQCRCSGSYVKSCRLSNCVKQRHRPHFSNYLQRQE